jgi:hypothetical protein
VLRNKRYYVSTEHTLAVFITLVMTLFEQGDKEENGIASFVDSAKSKKVQLFTLGLHS